MSSAGVIFDGDDTLWETAPLYARAKQQFFGQMSSLGFDPREVESAFHNIDVVNVDRLGFSKHRFPTSMAETYRLFCEKQDSRICLLDTPTISSLICFGVGQ
jgi:phosphoglycolate phosphatase-like HAD superfamily hydrolase